MSLDNGHPVLEVHIRSISFLIFRIKQTADFAHIGRRSTVCFLYSVYVFRLTNWKLSERIP